MTEFFLNEGIPIIPIIEDLRQHCRESMMHPSIHPSTVYYWVKEIKLGRNVLSNISPPGRHHDKVIADAIAREFAEDPHISVKKLADILNIAPSIVRCYLTKDLGIKFYHIQIGPTQVDICTKGQTYGNGLRNAARIRKEQVIQFSLLVYWG
jgi:hypothetical protein